MYMHGHELLGLKLKHIRRQLNLALAVIQETIILGNSPHEY